ncbi:hypothetical protein B0H34DRAFT_675502 [Crassisporium funariophilum]|nr:hypothetical protein B0H34DRAFT_675502 [Crassisporium funariophilum]
MGEWLLLALPLIFAVLVVDRLGIKPVPSDMKKRESLHYISIAGVKLRSASTDTRKNQTKKPRRLNVGKTFRSQSWASTTVTSYNTPASRALILNILAASPPIPSVPHDYRQKG